MVLKNRIQNALMWFLFLGAMSWPIVHCVLSKTLHFSSWRFFGWGMYATPSSDIDARLRIVLVDPLKQKKINVIELFSKIQDLSLDPIDESMCLNLFSLNAHNELKKLPKIGMCKSRKFAKDFDYFLSFKSKSHLSDFVKEVLSRVDQPNSQAFVYLTHQRIDLLNKKVYTESETYFVENDAVEDSTSVKYLGLFTRNEGLLYAGN